ncbi:MAG: LamG domain-containing protein, partial [Flavitalea sp.]
TNITDISGNGNTAAITVGALWTSSPIQFSGNALNFDGGNDVVTIPDNSTLQLTNALTIETWVYATSTSAVQNVIAKSSQLVNQGYIFPRTDNGWNTVTFYLYIAGGWRTLSAPFPSRNAWHHLAATYDGANMRVYINGVLASTMPQTGNVAVNSNALALGNQPGYTEYFTGSVDDIRIWNIVRTPAQILADMNRELDPSLQSGLVSYYTANQGVAASDNSGLTTLPDLAGTNNGTLSGFALSGAISNFVSQVPTLVVPVTWKSFTVQSAGNKKALLKWSTATEQNTKDFVIERSSNGRDWEGLAQVKAAGNSNEIRSYEYTDHHVMANRNYYRIHQRDLDNKSSFSIVRTLEANASEKIFVLLENPVRNNRISLQVNKDNTPFSLVNSNGVILWRKTCHTGVNNIYLPNLSKGIYLLRSGLQHERIVVQ